MKAITILQPWAGLVPLGLKSIETRSWATKYRGPLAIHAGLKPFDTRSYFDRELYRFSNALQLPNIFSFDQLSYGAVIGIAELVACYKIISVGEGFLCPKGHKSILLYSEDNKVNGSHYFGKTVTEDEIAFGDYTPGRFAWILASARPIEPIPARGMQRLWEWKEK